MPAKKKQATRPGNKNKKRTKKGVSEIFAFYWFCMVSFVNNFISQNFIRYKCLYYSMQIFPFNEFRVTERGGE